MVCTSVHQSPGCKGKLNLVDDSKGSKDINCSFYWIDESLILVLLK